MGRVDGIDVARSQGCALDQRVLGAVVAVDLGQDLPERIGAGRRDRRGLPLAVSLVNQVRIAGHAIGQARRVHAPEAVEDIGLRPHEARRRGAHVVDLETLFLAHGPFQHRGQVSAAKRQQPHLCERLRLFRGQQAGGHVVAARPDERAVGQLGSHGQAHTGRRVLHEGERALGGRCVQRGHGRGGHFEHRHVAGSLLALLEDHRGCAAGRREGGHADGAEQEVAAREKDLPAVRRGNVDAAPARAAGADRAGARAAGTAPVHAPGAECAAGPDGGLLRRVAPGGRSRCARCPQPAAAETAHIPHVPAAGIGFAPGVGAAARHCVAALGVARADAAGFRVVGMC